LSGITSLHIFSAQFFSLAELIEVDQMKESPLISIAIPDSLFADEDTLRGKTIKAGHIARAVSIFGIERIYIYRDQTKNYDREYETAKQIFQYAETPQYLRRQLISKKSDLEYVGLLPPLKIPHHMKESKVVVGEAREAVLTLQNGELRADVGSKELATYEGKGQSGQRVTVKIISEKPIKALQIQAPEDTYWGYEVRRAPNLARFLRSAAFELVILTSRLGENILQKWPELSSRSQSAERTLLCFGSPEAGVDKMLRQDNASVGDFPKAMYLNFFPFQKVATVRLEEAVIGCLSIMNLVSRLQT
jgi:predicted SPOUT superfamily RNA methylase MTH1